MIRWIIMILISGILVAGFALSGGVSDPRDVLWLVLLCFLLVFGLSRWWLPAGRRS